VTRCDQEEIFLLFEMRTRLDYVDDRKHLFALMTEKGSVGEEKRREEREEEEEWDAKVSEW